MDTIAVTRFKATCLSALERVARTGRPLRVTRYGKPLAVVMPPAPASARAGWIGGMRRKGAIRGDLVAPAVPARLWKALSR